MKPYPRLPIYHCDLLPPITAVFLLLRNMCFSGNRGRGCCTTIDVGFLMGHDVYVVPTGKFDAFGAMYGYIGNVCLDIYVIL